MVSVSFSQTCRIPDNDTLKHFPLKRPNIPNSGVVYYSLANIPNPSAQRSQILIALSIWNNALSSTCFGISFSEGSSPSSSNATLIFENTSNISGIARAEETASSGNEILIGTIKVNPNYAETDDQGNQYLYFDSMEDGYNRAFTKVYLHEIGHLLGMKHYRRNYTDPCRVKTPQDTNDDEIKESSVMNSGCGPNDLFDNVSMSVKNCDYDQLNSTYRCPCAGSTPGNTNGSCPVGYIPDPALAGYCCPTYSGGGTCGEPENPYCMENGNVGAYCCAINGWIWDESQCACTQPANNDGSPIIIDTTGNGYNLTDNANGVLFDLNSDGISERWSWTSTNSDDMWLVLDRNHNRLIDNGREMFGDYTAQPPSANPNSFIALAQFDMTNKGGNNDKVIDARDNVFTALRLWQDINHNGVSEANELHNLSELGIAELDLDYKESKRTDEHGNRFRYRAKVKDARGEHIGRWSWDVFLIPENRTDTTKDSANAKFDLISPHLGFFGLLVKKSFSRCGG